jgi:plastocyanin
MSKKIIVIFMFFSLVSVLIVACSRDTGSTSSTGDNNTASASAPTANASNGNEVHLSASTFAQSSITITKGSKLILVNDTSAFHNIQNGTWVKDAIQPVKENGAPMVKVPINGNDKQTIGPFTVAGTYHLCCVVHPGMNLTVIVQ